MTLTPSTPAAASGRGTCLIAEDDALIGMVLEDAAHDFGFSVVGPFARCIDALRWLGQLDGGPAPRLALLDFHLKDGPCTELAVALLGRGVPVVILSGQPQAWSHLGSGLRDVRWIEKPVPHAVLHEAVTALVTPPGEAVDPSA